MQICIQVQFCISSRLSRILWSMLWSSNHKLDTTRF